MKKGIKLTAAAALAVSAITPVAAFAAETTLAPGYYSSDAFTSVTEFAAKKTSEKKAFFKQNFGKSNFIFVDASGKVYDFLGANGEKILNATETELPKYATELVAYQTSKGVTVSESGIVKTTPDQKGELKVESVSAINSTQIKIVFNQKVEEESAQSLGNYYASLTKDVVTNSDLATFNDEATFNADGTVATAGYKAELQADEKTVIITAYNTDADPGAVVIWKDQNTPNATALSIDGTNDVTKDKTTYIQARNIVQQSTGLKGNTVQDSFVASDKSGPKFVATSFEGTPDATSFKVTFDEPVFATATTQYYFDGENITTQVNAGTWSNNGRTVEITLPSGSKLEEGTFKFEAVGLQDFSGNASAPSRIVTDIVVAEKEADTAAPKLIDIVQIHDGAFNLIFDKQVTQGTVTIKNLINDNTDAVIDLAAGAGVVTLPTDKIGGKGEFKDYYAVTVEFAADGGSSTVDDPFTPVDYNQVFKTTTNSSATEIYRTIELNEIATATSAKTKKSSTREKFVLDNIAPTFVEVEVNDDNEDLVISFVDNPFKGESLQGSNTNPVILKFEEDGITYTYNVDTSDFSNVANNLVSLGLTPGNQPKLFDTNNKLKNGKYTITLPREYVKDNSADATPQFLGEFEFVGLTTTFEFKGNANEDVPQTAQRLVEFDEDLNAISVQFVGKNIDPATAKNVANYKFDGEALPAGTVIEYTEDTTSVPATGTALIYLPANSVERDGDYTLVVSNVATKNGAKMLTTTVQVEDVKDNTQPLFTSAVVTSNNTIELTFNETLSGATLGTAATTGDSIANANRNLKVVIGGAEYTVDTVTAKTSRVLVITTVDVFDTAKTVQVKLAKDASGDIHIFDIAKNKAAEKTVTATKDIQ